jgi:prevent-host-death family protein
MRSTKRQNDVPEIVSVLELRNNLGKMINNSTKKGVSYLVEKRGQPQAVVMSVKEYIRLAAPEPEILKILGEESVARGTHKISMKEIDAEIAQVRKLAKKNTSRHVSS